jgi:hypothetical protein
MSLPKVLHCGLTQLSSNAGREMRPSFLTPRPRSQRNIYPLRPILASSLTTQPARNWESYERTNDHWQGTEEQHRRQPGCFLNI